ncbi:MAG: sigma-70 family RNA polymerase sigma factor [Acidobacteria bacterium]|nr:sigma-70 family RNA polymerase sigma factor [Acidobacteriota bacterium]
MRFARSVEPALRMALTAGHGFDRGLEATNDVLVYAWKHWDRISTLDNPAGYLFRVGQRKARRRRLVPDILSVSPVGRYPWFEPHLSGALKSLSSRQRQVVVLIEAYEWTFREVAEFLEMRPSSVQTHHRRAMERLRVRLGVNIHG